VENFSTLSTHSSPYLHIQHVAPRVATRRQTTKGEPCGEHPSVEAALFLPLGAQSPPHTSCRLFVPVVRPAGLCTEHRQRPAAVAAKGTDEAAAMLGVHPKTLQRLARSGRITAYRVGKLWRFQARDLWADVAVRVVPWNGLYDGVATTSI
jgi:excisionase family DNA binding protein